MTTNWKIRFKLYPMMVLITKKRKTLDQSKFDFLPVRNQFLYPTIRTKTSAGQYERLAQLNEISFGQKLARLALINFSVRRVVH